MNQNSHEMQCFYASSRESADVRYLTGILIPDPFVLVRIGRRTIAVVNRLEYGRVRARSRCDEVLELGAAAEEAARTLSLERDAIGPAELFRFLARRERAGSFAVPADFPSRHYAALLASEASVRIAEASLVPERLVKTDAEARAIRQGNAASAAGIRAAEGVLRASRIRGKRLIYEGRPLTSERLRSVIDQACIAKGAIPQDTIVAGGRQACDPHEVGHGPLRPDELIIIDVFPCVQATGYHGDLTRTFLKGRPSDGQRALVEAVRAAQKAAIDRVKVGVKGANVHRAADEVFCNRGFLTERRGEAFVGFIHSTGHGLGLEVHEEPRVSPHGGSLRNGHVVTIEPGLYYPEIGGCRIEDVIRVTKDGAEKLSSLHGRWVIP